MSTFIWYFSQELTGFSSQTESIFMPEYSTSQQTISDLEKQLSEFVDFEKSPSSSHSQKPFCLNIMERLAARLGLFDLELPIIQIVGSKGKGTTALLTEALLSSWNVRVGLFHSPHIVERRERIRIDGKVVSVDLWQRVVEKVLSGVKHMPEKPSRFEIETVIAMCCFADEQAKIDVVILEAGLGGKNDATSLFPAQITLLTSVELEHTAILGNRIEQITRQKIGMIRSKTSLIVGPLSLESMRLVRSYCSEEQVRLWEVGVEVAADQIEAFTDGIRFVIESGHRKHRVSKPVFLPCYGLHLPSLTALAYGAVELFAQQWKGGRYPSECADVLQALQLPGRLQAFSEEPHILIDSAHTRRSMASALLSCHAHFSRWPKAILFAINQDKDLESLLSLALAHTDALYITRNPGARAAEPSDLIRQCRALIQEGIPHRFLDDPGRGLLPLQESKDVEEGKVVLHVFEDIPSAWNAFQEQLQDSELGLVTGSFGLLGEVVRAG